MAFCYTAKGHRPSSSNLALNCPHTNLSHTNQLTATSSNYLKQGGFKNPEHKKAGEILKTLASIYSHNQSQGFRKLHRDFSINPHFSAVRQVQLIVSKLLRHMNFDKTPPQLYSTDDIINAFLDYYEKGLVEFWKKLPGGKDFLNTAEMSTLPNREKVKFLRIWMLDHQEALSQIRQLDLSHLNLHFIPKEINLLFNLEVLDLSHNKIDVIPQNFGSNLKKLSNLNLAKNQLTELPANFGQNWQRLLTASKNLSKPMQIHKFILTR